MGLLRRLRSDERGIALVMALGIMIVMAIMVTGVISFTTGNGHSSARAASRIQERIYAEAGVNYTQSILQKQLAVNPSAANLLGCTGAGGPADTTGPSNCTSPTLMTICFRGASCTAGSADSASVYGYYSGTSSQTYLGRTIPASTWLIVSTGYASDTAKGGVNLQTVYGRVHISSANSGAVAAVWNHVFLTKPLVPNVCQTDFESNDLIIDVPLYVIGNLCLSGNNNIVKEVGQPVDLQVGGKLYNNGNTNSVGVSASTPITSGVVVGGCTTTGISAAGQTCGPAHKYWVATPVTYNTTAAPTQSATDITNDYNNFDPGPKHACQSGTTPPPLASTVFDTDTVYNNKSAATFELTPSSSYSCISTSGASVGQLTWDNTLKKLTINGAIFLDADMTISQTAYYVGTAIIEVTGAITINGQGTTVCATSPCNTTSGVWQGSSGNNSMLTLAPLKSSATALTLAANTQTFQGSVWTQPSSTVALNGNNDTLQGPLSMGTISTPSNNASLKPMPVIKNMPVGAPLPPNTGVTIDPVVYD